MIIRSGKKSYVNVACHYLGKTNGRVIAQFLIVAQFLSGVLYPAISKILPKSKFIEKKFLYIFLNKQ